MKKYLYPVFFFTAVMITAPGCVNVFSELQGARMTGEKNFEVTPFYSATSASEEGQSEKVQNHIGLQASYGVTPDLDLRLRIENIWLKEGDFSDGITIIGIGPKVKIAENIAAIYLPFGRALGENTRNSWQLHPTLLLSYPAISQKLDINVSPKVLLSFCEDCQTLAAVNFGLAISSDLSKWAIRPEYGLLYNLGEEGHASHFSLGLTARLVQ